jgi:hypothetical protein
MSYEACATLFHLNIFSLYVQVYDLRYVSLTTGSSTQSSAPRPAASPTTGDTGLVAQYIAPATSTATGGCELHPNGIVSVQYTWDGKGIVASYLGNHIYLFNTVRGQPGAGMSRTTRTSDSSSSAMPSVAADDRAGEGLGTHGRGVSHHDTRTTATAHPVDSSRVTATAPADTPNAGAAASTTAVPTTQAAESSPAPSFAQALQGQQAEAADAATYPDSSLQPATAAVDAAQVALGASGEHTPPTAPTTAPTSTTPSASTTPWNSSQSPATPPTRGTGFTITPSPASRRGTPWGTPTTQHHQQQQQDVLGGARSLIGDQRPPAPGTPQALVGAPPLEPGHHLHHTYDSPHQLTSPTPERSTRHHSQGHGHAHESHSQLHPLQLQGNPAPQPLHMQGTRAPNVATPPQQQVVTFFDGDDEGEQAARVYHFSAADRAGPLDPVPVKLSLSR